MSYESKGYAANYLGAKRHKHNQSRIGIGYKPSQFLTPMTQKDIVKMDTKPQPVILPKQTFISKAKGFFRRILGR